MTLAENPKEKNLESERTVTVPSVQVFLFRQGERGLEFYLGHRIAGSFLGQWSVPGGAIDRHETSRHAALRETEEEAGVLPEDEKLVFYRVTSASTLRTTARGVKVRYQYPIDVYFVNADNLHPFNNSPQEHDEMLWMTLEEAVLMNEQALGEARSRGVTDLVNIPGIVSLRVMDTMMLLSAAFDPEPSA